MDIFNIDDEQAYSDYVEYLNQKHPECRVNEIERIIETDEFTVRVDLDYYESVMVAVRDVLALRNSPEKVILSNEDFDAMMKKVDVASTERTYDPLIYGKDATESIVSIEIVDNEAWLFREIDGTVTIDKRPYKHWMLSNKPSRDGSTVKLEGNQFFKYIKEYENREEWDESRKLSRKFNLYCVTNPVEGFMIRHGYTYFKGMKLAEVSTLSFDIETAGLNPHAPDAQVFIITNTFRKLGKITRKMFSIDEYSSERTMLMAWCSWVQEMNPTVMLGHNIVGYDFKYLDARAKSLDMDLALGRDCSPIQFEDFQRKFRKDGSQSYSYNRVHVFGRNVIDTFFVAIKYDIGRKFSSYRLKTLIKEEGLEKTGRTFIDASKIKQNWNDLAQRELIKKYAEEDSDDALHLYDKFIPSQFYMCPYLPKPMQIITESATGAQLNSLMVRAYLQDNQSVALPSDAVEYQGATSFGVPGIYRNCWKIDITSCYPHTLLQYKIFDKYKDPKAYLIRVTEYFLKERLKDKQTYKETGDEYFNDMSNSKKVIVNSLYGFCGAPGLNYNYPAGAALITKKAREIIDTALIWASDQGSEFWMSKVGKEESEEEDE